MTAAGRGGIPFLAWPSIPLRRKRRGSATRPPPEDREEGGCWRDVAAMTLAPPEQRKGQKSFASASLRPGTQSRRRAALHQILRLRSPSAQNDRQGIAGTSARSTACSPYSACTERRRRAPHFSSKTAIPRIIDPSLTIDLHLCPTQLIKLTKLIKLITLFLRKGRAILFSFA